MKISSISNYSHNLSFKGATVNINAFSDTHGELILANNALEEMRDRQNDIFCKEGKGKANILVCCGDWFMDGNRKGYKTNPQKVLARFQLTIFNALISKIKEIAPQKTVLFLSGNHEFDGGVKLLSSILSKIDADVLATNMDFENSPAFNKCIKKNKMIQEKIIEIDDDKRPDLTHKIMVLGVMPVNLQSYQPDLKGLTLINNVNKPQAYVTPEDYKETFKLCEDKINKFKEDNPDGIVVFMSHTGVSFSDNLAKTAPVDLIFDGHEHKENIRYVNGTPIIPLSQNFKKIVNAKLTIDDNGQLKKIKPQDFNPTTNTKKGDLLKLYYQLFKEDIKRVYSVNTQDPDIILLDVNNIRVQNNYLANFITDSVLEEIQKQDSSVDFFALNSSSMRHPLRALPNRPSISLFDIKNVLAGIKEEDGQIMTTEISGKELSYIVADNYLFNKDLPQKNPLIHYSGLITDRTQILKALKQGKDPASLTEYIIDTKTMKPIDPNKTYKIANVEKYFNKSQNNYIKELKNRSQYLGDTVQNLFLHHFISSEGKLQAKCDTRIL